jgi:prevent-host-death family protein
MATVNIHDAKTHLSRLLERVAAGERITIARAGRPIADLVPHVRADVVFGRFAGEIHYDPATFDDADAEILELFGLDD